MKSPMPILFTLSAAACLITLRFSKKGQTKLENSGNQILQHEAYLAEYEQLLRTRSRQTSTTFCVVWLLILSILVWLYSKIKDEPLQLLGLLIMAPPFVLALILATSAVEKIRTKNAIAKLNNRYLTYSELPAQKPSGLANLASVLVLSASLLFGLYLTFVLDIYP